jgi:regulator of protease activity HflC (stomatin/prohibitin superfamily)
MWSVGSFVGLIVLGTVIYFNCRIDVGTGEMAILVRKTGLDISNTDEISPSLEHKGVQAQVLTEGRYFQNPFDKGPGFFNPYDWDWEVIPQTEIPDGKLGVLISLVGDDPHEYGNFLGELDELDDERNPKPKGMIFNPKTKGIIEEPLKPGRYAINPHLFAVEIHEPITIEAGHKGVVTNLSGPLPKRTPEGDAAEGSAGPDDNLLQIADGQRGVQKTLLDAGTHYINPYITRINIVDTRSQRFNLAETKDMGFPSKDGFWVSLDGTIQFRIKPESAAEVYVTYNEDKNGDAIDEEIIRKIIMPNARSFCRLEGSQKLGREFIEGETRMEFQKLFQEAMVKACEPLGIEILEALINEIKPPQKIAEAIRQREQAALDVDKYLAQIQQQDTEALLATEAARVLQKSALVKIEQDIVKLTTEAEREQAVAVTKAEEGLAVATLKLEAAENEAKAIAARGQAAADVIGFENQADAAGWKRAVEAFSGNGQQYAQFVLYQKLSTAYRRIMVNTADSPIMKMFESISERSPQTLPVRNSVNTRPAEVTATSPETTAPKANAQTADSGDSE